MMTDNNRDALLDAIRLRAVNDLTRAIARDGISLTHDEADDLGEQAIDWLHSRLGLRVTTTHDGVECMPKAQS